MNNYQIPTYVYEAAQQWGQSVPVPRMIMYAPMFQLVWRNVDATSNSSSAINETASASPQPTPPQPTAEPVGLSDGAKAGIGVGVGLFVVLSIGALAWFILRYRRRRLQGGPVEPEEHSAVGGGLYGQDKAELPGQAQRRTHELDNEVDSGRQPSELAAIDEVRTPGAKRSHYSYELE